MAVIRWIDDGSDFGNARGLDYVALDVKVAIARRFGATVLMGQLPADLAAIQKPCELDAETEACLTISWDGGTVSSESRDGNRSTRGYWTSDWARRVGADTVVFDLRTIPEDRVVRYAVRGPMLNPALPAGTISTLRGSDIPKDLIPVADDYLRASGGLAATGALEEV